MLYLSLALVLGMRVLGLGGLEVVGAWRGCLGVQTPAPGLPISGPSLGSEVWRTDSLQAGSSHGILAPKQPHPRGAGA